VSRAAGGFHGQERPSSYGLRGGSTRRLATVASDVAVSRVNVDIVAQGNASRHRW
jgi:hypothetical protein